MKHIKPYKIFENSQEYPNFPTTEKEVHDICKKYKIEDYTINDDLSIDVEDEEVDLAHNELIYLPLKFNYISGDFICGYNSLISLEGSPKEVEGFFDCSNNQLKSLKGGPKKVGSYFDCSYNILISLKDSPSEVGHSFNCRYNELMSLDGFFGLDKEVELMNFICSGNNLTTLKGCEKLRVLYFGCDNNNLTTLEGGPKGTLESYWCNENNLISLKGSPKRVNGDFNCCYNKLKSLDYLPSEVNFQSTYTLFHNNPIFNLISSIFINSRYLEQFLFEFNEYDIVRGDKVVLSRLKAFINDFDLEMPNLELIKKDYKIV